MTASFYGATGKSSILDLDPVDSVGLRSAPIAQSVKLLKKALASPIEDIGIQPLSFPLRLRLWQRTTWAAVVLGTTSLV